MAERTKILDDNFLHSDSFTKENQEEIKEEAESVIQNLFQFVAYTI